jgi:glycine hydroxymethyltransferase
MTERDPSLAAADPEVHALMLAEDRRQRDSIRLIASENYVSKAVLEACASSLTNKYAEGYPGRRYYEGMDFIDPLERLAIERALALFGADHANVQPYSGSPANLAALLALCEPGDTTMGLALPAGGHLTHGWKVSATGIYYRSVQYGVRESDHRIDLDQVRELAKQHRPKVIWVGHSAYPRVLDFAGFAEIANEVGAHLVADIAHIAGLVVGGVHPSPVPHCAAVTTTTHKTLRGPRGGLVLCRKEHAKAIDKSVFPGLQGGPHNATTAAKAVAFKEASTPEFRAYAAAVVANAKALAEALMGHGRDRQPPDARRRHESRHLGSRRRAGAQSLRHRAQRQLDPVRQALAVRPLGRAHRHPGIELAWACARAHVDGRRLDRARRGRGGTRRRWGVR